MKLKKDQKRWLRLLAVATDALILMKYTKNVKALQRKTTKYSLNLVKKVVHKEWILHSRTSRLGQEWF